MNDYVLAIDGGQTATVCLLGTLDGVILGSGLAGPASLAQLPNAEERMRTALTEAIHQALAHVYPCPNEVNVVYLSLTGGVELALSMVPTILPSKEILAESDAIAALASGTFGNPGVGLVAGTGVVSVALKSDGSRIIRGGWGYLLGDAGGGYWIGLQALKAAICADDGSGSASPLFAQLMKRMNVKSMREAADRIYAEQITRPDIASLCPLVMAFAKQGDLVSRAIVDDATEHLVKLVKAVCVEARFRRAGERLIVPTGGVLSATSPVQQKFAARVAEELPRFRLVLPRFPPVVGAYILGLRLADVMPTEAILNHMERSLSELPVQHLSKDLHNHLQIGTGGY